MDDLRGVLLEGPNADGLTHVRQQPQVLTGRFLIKVKC